VSYQAFSRVGTLLSPNQISDLQTVFNTVCEVCHEAKQSPTAHECAAVLIRSVQRGILDRDMLKDIGIAVMRRSRL
jgi:cytochrome c5